MTTRKKPRTRTLRVDPHAVKPRERDRGELMRIPYLVVAAPERDLEDRIVYEWERRQVVAA